MSSWSFFINRWLLSTNAKDIGVQYIIFAGLSGLVGSTLSFKIRQELSGGGSVYFLGNYHDYNVTITGHAILKIFFKVKPAMLGGFGKYFIKAGGLSPSQSQVNEKENPLSLGSKQNRRENSFIKKTNQLGPYLAGLIEGDGCIYVSEKRNNSVIITICFHENDEPLVKLIMQRLGYGRIQYPKAGRYLLQHISTYAGLYRTVEFINGYFRTPKQEAQNRQIDFLNMHLDYLNKTSTGKIYTPGPLPWKAPTGLPTK